MKKYIKTNGILPDTDFQKGDIVVLENRNMKLIMILDNVGYHGQLDILSRTWICVSEDETPYLRHVENQDGVIWHNNAVLRDATLQEYQELIKALSENLPKGTYELNQ